VSITKVVLLITRNPTKLSFNFSEFSTIFYAFYKFQQSGNTIGDTFCTEAPGKIWDQAIGSLDPMGGGLTGIPAAPAAIPIGEWVGVDRKLT
jgi:hypothetical protein